MADAKISQLVDGGVIQVTDNIPVQRGVTNNRVQVGSLASQSTIDNADWSGTALSIANGGTGATTVAGAQTALGAGAVNGLAQLDGAGKVPASQLTISAMEYKGTWDAATNTPTLADGSGNTGDVYNTSVAGTQDLGSGNITFAVGDWVLYNGATWEKSANTNDPITLTGDVTGSGTGSFPTTISNNSVTYAKFQDVPSDRLIGRQTPGSGDVEEITCTSSGRALIAGISAADQRGILGSGLVGDQLFQANTVNIAQQAMDVEVGVDVQAYDANTAFTNVQQTFTAEQNFSYTTSLVKIGSFSGTTYTPTIIDGGRLLLSFNSTGCTFTIPAYASVPFPIGTTIAIVQYGLGQVTVLPGGGVALLSKNNDRKTAAQYSSVSLLHFSTNNWMLVGDITA
jgi:hypothetical protein